MRDDTFLSEDENLGQNYKWSNFTKFLVKLEDVFLLSEKDYDEKFFQNKMQNYIYDVYVNDDDLNDHIDNYRRDIKKGYKVVLLAHSQGNFYANFAYDMLYKVENREITSTDSLGIVSVGTPASRVKDNFDSTTAPYTTFNVDKPMLGVRTLFSDTLPANDKEAKYNKIPSLDKCDGDKLCHSFVKAYTNILNTSRTTIMKNVINVAESLDKSHWKQVGEEYTKHSCYHRLKMQNVNTGESIKVYPFNTESGKIYQVGEEWVMASYGGNKIVSVQGLAEYEKNDCYTLRNTKDIMKKVTSSECSVEASKASEWDIEYISPFDVTLTHKVSGGKIYNVYPFNTNGYVYQAGSSWVVGSCGGETVFNVKKDDGEYIKEYYELVGTDDIIWIRYEPKNPTPIPTPSPTNIPSNSFDCNGDGRGQGFEISATYCSTSSSDNGRFWLRDEGFVYKSSTEKNAYYVTLADEYQYCGVSDKSIIKSFGGDSACGVAHVFWDYVGDNSNSNLRTLRKVNINSKGKKKEELSVEVINSLGEHNKTLYENNSLF